MPTPVHAIRRPFFPTRAALALGASVLVCGCAGAAAGPVAVFAPAGTRQCEPARDDLHGASARLAAAGVQARAARCAHDGRVRAAMCGLPDGRIVVVDVAPDSVDAARAAGWRPLAEMPDAVPSACR